jgi:drug/metabolite transporter (DMT)-like permease
MSEAASGWPVRARWARPLLWLAMPALGLANQYCAERVAHVTTLTPFGAAWFAHAAATPWLWAWVALELVTLTVWVVVLSELKVSEAFPMTALGYMLVIGLGWFAFGEPITALEIAGGAMILGGVWLLGEPEAVQP